MTKRVALIGASGHGKVVSDIAFANGAVDVIFYDDHWCEINTTYGAGVIGDVAQGIHDSKDFDAVYVSIGNCNLRAEIQTQLHNIGPPLIHPSAVVSQSVHIGKGTVVMPMSVINAGVVIGDGVIINTGAVIEHDCKIDDFTHICPQAALAGGVHVGTQSWVGIGASVIQQIKIGSYALVGAGAVVIQNVIDHQTVVGNPAKPIKR